MKLHILGCGTSTGVPMPGCDCTVCLSPHPRNKRLRTSALISNSTSGNILIDASTDFRQQALRANIKSLAGVVFTHAHADHILGIDDLRSFNYVMRRSIDCYGDAATLSEIKKVFNYVFERDPKYQGGMPPQLTLHEIRMFEPFRINGTELLPFPLEHGGVQVTGLRIANVAYATDVKVIPEESKKAMSNLDFLVLDGLREDPHPTHLTIAEAIEVISELGVKQAYLTHMSHTVDYEETSKSLPKNVALAFDGLEINL